MLPGAHYSDPELSWKFAIAPSAIGFLDGRALGPQYDGDRLVAAARTFLQEGYLLRFNLTGNRQKIGVNDPRLEDRVADNPQKFDITESETLQFGRGFGIGTDIQTGLNGNYSWCRCPTAPSTKSSGVSDEQLIPSHGIGWMAPASVPNQKSVAEFSARGARLARRDDRAY